MTLGAITNWLTYLFTWLSLELGWACGSVVVKSLCNKPEGCGFDTPLSDWIFAIYLILPAALGPGVYSVSIRNEYQKQKIIFLGVERGRRVVLATLPPPVSRLSRHCEILNILQLYRSSRPVKGIALVFVLYSWTLNVEAVFPSSFR
jgi:hypothetical protein